MRPIPNYTSNNNIFKQEKKNNLGDEKKAI